MRKVEVEQAWDHAIEKDRRFRVRAVITRDKRPLGDFACDLPNGLVIICGLNGVGKTTLLRLMFEALGGESTVLRQELLDAGTFECTLELDGQDLVAPFGNQSPVGVSYLDAADECARMLALAKQQNFEDLTEGFDPRDWTEAEVAEARFVIGKAYEAIQTTEFDDPGPPIAPSVKPDDSAQIDSPVLALTEVEIGGLSYDFRTMGLGEFAALTLLWRLRRLRANTVVLLEEPETYLSARASTSLVSVLARTVSDSRLYAVVTTHSPGVIREAPLGAVRILVPEADQMVLREPGSSAEIEYMLGFPTGPARIILVEDNTALDFVRELIGRYAGAWVGDVTYLRTGGVEPLVAVCKKFPTTTSVYLAGVLDGDQAVPHEELTWPVLVLPGDGNPDSILRQAVLSNIEAFAQACARDAAMIRTACQVHAGENEHDWFHAIADQLGLDVHGLRRHAVAMWLLDPDNEREAERLVRDVVEILTGRG